ncbi:thymidine phosphorylase [Crateriforma conspicua]|uniref:thymidine phosphorylase n=1 Tax=Crateriforma conspicua TaxID=2527996 RepID=A0A5C5Y3N6_9PLAN|nr:thymidine phosphorylase [Crateriforma conspicua]QDV64362.1 Pyrimidine-nucleoside phosphorylase [Crateriforma conspicua]TWT69764.1 Pyrimidine-nucleoside phosphorylase [Crateriforma conspicua]
MITDLLATKRDAAELSGEEIRSLIEGFVRGDVADYQMSAFAMAVRINGMTDAETSALTAAMVDSGDCFDRLTDRPRLDKHSTGGVGDKISLILAPLLAAAGAEVPMISGRGLGHTGGTLDKLESIPGFQIDLSAARRNEVLKQVGACIVGADASIAPGDRRLYALRDVTATIDSIPLITASILSKKLAATLDALLIDVKVGRGAFMTSVEQAESLARSLIRVGTDSGLPTAAILSDMNQPLGRSIGNANEVNESLDVLDGGGPDEVRELTLASAEILLVQGGLATDVDQARSVLTRLLDDGSAMEKFQQMVHAQGGRLPERLALADAHVITAPESGTIAQIDAIELARIVAVMGGGRQKVDDVIDATVGLDVHGRVGSRVETGQPIATLYQDGEPDVRYIQRVHEAIVIRQQQVEKRPLLIRRYPFE